MSSEGIDKTEGICLETRRLEKMLGNAGGLVFDCDGTLLDTMPMYYESWKLACDEFGLEFPIERFYDFAGRTVRDIFQTLIDEQLDSGTSVTSDICEEAKKRHHANIEAKGRHAGRIDVVVDIAFKYHGKLPMAVASSGWRNHVLTGLERVGILHLFDAVVTACDDDVRSPKPAPDIFLVAANRIGIDPRKCIGFEDADLGMKAVKDAGFMYASDVRLLHMYPRNVEERSRRQNDDGGDRNPSKGTGGKGTRPTVVSSAVLSLLSLATLVVNTETLSPLFASSRRQLLSNGIAASGLLGLNGVTVAQSNANAVDELPTQLRQYTALAPLGSPSAMGTKTSGLSLSDIASRLTRDLTEGSKGRGGYFVSGDLSPEIFRDDCIFVDPTNSVSSLSRYQNALRILFDPEKSAVRLVSPLAVNEGDRTVTGKIRSWGVLQLPWQPRVSSYETSIKYSIDNDGLIYSQVQEWNISASEALQETFVPSPVGPPFSHLSRPADEPAEVTELFELVNGHLQDSYPKEVRARISSLIDKVTESRHPWRRGDLPGKWALVYLQPGPGGGGVDRRIPFPEFWFNRSYQVFSRDAVTNVGELLGPLLEVRVGGGLREEDGTSLRTPKRFRASIEGGAVCLGGSEAAPCLPLPIAGEGLFDGVYLGERLRIGQNLNGGGARVVQVKLRSSS